MYRNNVFAARVELLQVNRLKVSGVAVSKSPATLLTCNNSTLAAETLFLDTLSRGSFK